MSKIATVDNTNVAGIVANMIAPSVPTSAPKRAAPTHRVIAKSASDASAVGSRAANSDSPSSVTEAACSQ